jgi:aspartate carbamoyltransferase catalytic subunit
MSLFQRSILSIDDLSVEEIAALFDLARKIQAERASYFRRLEGTVIATLFYEPSTRTRLSFESAAQRLGSGIIHECEPGSSSAAKGESLADTCRVVSGYADAIVLRHPWEGAARYVADKVGIPVINAGDGGHEHPTQTLCDLYTMSLRHERLEDLEVAICGDLKYGRTVHSLVYALARLRSHMTLAPADQRELPEHLVRKLRTDYKLKFKRSENSDLLKALYGTNGGSSDQEQRPDFVYVTEPYQADLLHGGVKVTYNDLQIYITRAQKERHGDGDHEGGFYPKVTPSILKNPFFENSSILHPLPRVDEISPEIDDDPRSLYFQQAANGIPIRMALLLSILGCSAQDTRDPGPTPFRPHCNEAGSHCDNGKCITSHEANVPAKFYLVPDHDGYWLRCYYCEHDFLAEVYGNLHGGKQGGTKVFHPADQLENEDPKPENVVFFRTEVDALQAGFVRVSVGTRRAPKNSDYWPRLPILEDEGEKAR